MPFVAAAIDTLKSHGMIIPSTIVEAEVVKVYFDALEGQAAYGLSRAVRGLIRKEYDWASGSFMPTPPDLAMGVRMENKVLADDQIKLQHMKRTAGSDDKPRGMSKEKYDYIMMHIAKNDSWGDKTRYPADWNVDEKLRKAGYSR